MKNQELPNKSDIEKKGQLLQGKNIQTGLELGGHNEFMKSVLSKICDENSPESYISILTSPEFSHSINLSQKLNINNYLQQTYGNRDIQRMVQAKLKISQPNDKYEQEAERIADKVMKMSEPQVQQLNRERKRNEEIICIKENSDQSLSVSPDLESHIAAIKGCGEPLLESTRKLFEPCFGYNFSQVRVYTNKQVAELSEALNARAFTVGRDILFGKGQYAPHSAEGKHLLAHELAHIVHQSGNTARLSRLRAKEHLLSEQSLASEMIRKRKGPWALPVEAIYESESREIYNKIFLRWLEKRIDIIPLKEPQRYADTDVILRIRTYNEDAYTITSEYGYGIEGSIKAEFKKLSGEIKGSYKKSWKTDKKYAKREEMINEKKFTIIAYTREAEAIEIIKQWLEWRGYFKKGGKTEGLVPIVEKPYVREEVSRRRNITQLGFKVISIVGGKWGSWEEFWPKYFYILSGETLEGPLEESALKPAIKYIREQGEKSVMLQKKIFEEVHGTPWESLESEELSGE